MGVIQFLVFFNFIFGSSAGFHDLLLVSLQVLVRHGARYPDKKELSAAGSDEYSLLFNNSDTLGQLLTVGMKQQYEFGKMLRGKYDQFLGGFKYEEVYARSTNYDRTKMSLQLVLAGLYPPTEHTSWSDRIQWSPIPAFYEKEKQIDFLDLTSDSVCMKNGELVDEVINSPDILNRMQKYRKLAKKLEGTTGVKKLTPAKGYELYAYLSSILSMRLPLPSWCTPEDLAQLREIAGISMDTLVYTPQMRRIMIGMTIEEILKNIDNNENDKRKIFLYSAHDTNVGPFVRVHNFTGVPIFPEFGSAVIVEKLKSEDGQIYVRMFYWTGATEKLIPLKLENCDHICLLSEYRLIVAPLFPNEDEKACFSPKHCATTEN